MTQPLVSIVVPVYNVENYFDKCITSVRKQSYSNLEIILVDDGSTDRSGTLCDQCANEDARITAYHTANRGLSAARNEGIKHATGEYITFVDSDDYIGLSHIANLVKALKVYPEADLVITGATRFFEGHQCVDNEFSMTIVKELSPEEAIRTAITVDDDHFSVNAWGKLYKNTLFSFLAFPEGRVFEDNYVYYKVICNASHIIYENANDYFYLEDRSTSITNTKTAQNLDELNAYKEMLPYVKEYAPKAFDAVFSNYVGKLISYYALAERLKEKAASNTLYEMIIKNRHQVLRMARIPASTRIAYFLTYFGRAFFALAVKISSKKIARSRAKKKQTTERVSQRD